MKKLGLGPKMILSFLVAIAGSVVICGLITYSRTKNVLNSNMQLTSEQTLESALNSLADVREDDQPSGGSSDTQDFHQAAGVRGSV